MQAQGHKGIFLGQRVLHCCGGSSHYSCQSLGSRDQEPALSLHSLMSLGLVASGSNDNHLCPEITAQVHWLQSLCQHTPGENLTLPNGETKLRASAPEPVRQRFMHLASPDIASGSNELNLFLKTTWKAMCHIYHRAKGGDTTTHPVHRAPVTAVEPHVFTSIQKTSGKCCTNSHLGQMQTQNKWTKPAWNWYCFATLNVFSKQYVSL